MSLRKLMYLPHRILGCLSQHFAAKVDAMKMASISFNPNKMEFLISFASGEISEDKEQEILNLGQAQILMDISQEKGSLVAIKVLLPTPLGDEAMNAVKKSAKKSELKITSDR
jgi:hypothetical protein